MSDTHLPAPVIDVSPLRSLSGPATATECVAAIHAACIDTGFFVVTGHGIEERLADVRKVARTFFASPQELKESTPRLNRYGFVPHTSTAIDTSRQSDNTEFLDMGLHDEVPLPAIEGFESAVRDYQHAALDLAHSILRALSVGLGIDEDFFAARMGDPQCRLRFLHYPQVQTAADGTVPVPATPHTDYGAITILATDGVPGLQVRCAGVGWVPVTAHPSDLVVNLGDMLARWTNDTYHSTVHRVVGPIQGDRISIPFFVNPDPDTVVECIPTCVSATNPCNYDPIRAGDFLAQRIDSPVEPYLDQ